ncbi:MAG TPA: hypothetical protein VH253_02060 [Phycisphaerae bacterium]|nr:hypothetical protein [Phycisphaerae bacterium]
MNAGGCGRGGWVLAAVVVLAVGGCTENALMPDTDISENGAILIVPAPVKDVNGYVQQLEKEWKLVVAKEQAGDTQGEFELSTTTSAVSVSTSAAGVGSTRVSIYPETMVTAAGGQSQSAADPRYAMELEKSLVGRMEDRYHVKAVGTGDPAWQEMLENKKKQP